MVDDRNIRGGTDKARIHPDAPPATTNGDHRVRRHTEPDGMPGRRADLPPGSLPGPYLEAQGDENRTPPANAPSKPPR
jgi:hypothetical protein